MLSLARHSIDVKLIEWVSSRTKPRQAGRSDKKITHTQHTDAADFTVIYHVG